MKNNPQEHYTPYQLKLPVEIGKIIEISDPVYSFCEVMNHVDLYKYLTVEECCKCKGNRIIRLNEELTRFHSEVLSNLNIIHGALLRMNRSIQAEGTFGTIKWNRSYIRARRRGLKSLIFGLFLYYYNIRRTQ